MNPILVRLTSLGLDDPAAQAAVAVVAVVVAMRIAAWLMDLPEPGIARCLGSVLGSALLAAISAKLLGWIPWVGGPMAGLLAWFLTVATLEELHDTTLDRAAVTLGVAVSLVLGVGVGLLV